MINRFDIKKHIYEAETIACFSDVATNLCQEKRIRNDDMYGFKIVSTTKKFTNADDVKSVLHISTSLKEVFKLYEKPYQYVCALKEKITPDTVYKCFVKVDYSVKNQYGLDVSGGERAEFNLIHALKDAYTYDMVLIDEPESSFDNLFLASKIKSMIKELAEKMPVIVSTHNNTIGASFFPNRVLYTKRIITHGNSPVFQVYSGAFLDKTLKDRGGNIIDNYGVYMNSLEGGENQYDERKGRIYEAVKNR
jgi:ABC-type lipopolysaccharide export system ATPase subunit